MRRRNIAPGTRESLVPALMEATLLLDLGGPLGFGIRVGRSVQASEQFGGQLGPSMLVEAQGVGQDYGSYPGHDDPILTLGPTAHQALAADGPQAHHGPRLKRRRSADVMARPEEATCRAVRPEPLRCLKQG